MPEDREGYGGHIWPKTPKMALIAESLAADLSPIIVIGKFSKYSESFLTPSLEIHSKV